MLRAVLYRSGHKEARPSRSGPLLSSCWIVLLGQSFGLVLAEETLEQAAVTLLVAQDVDHHILRNQVDLIGRLHEPGVELYRAGLGVYHAPYDVHHVGLVLGRLQGL